MLALVIIFLTAQSQFPQGSKRIHNSLEEIQKLEGKLKLELI